jgi:hypothetical protein
MGFPAGFPLYFDGKYHVSLAFPPLTKQPSEISKVVGVTASYPLLVPNIDFLQSFIKGDIGIANKMMQESLLKNFNHPIASKDEKVFKKFSEISGSEVTDVKKYKKDGKLKMPKDDIKVPKMDGIGFNGFEKTVLTSIFETQKPYFEIAKLVIGNIAKIEDIIARVMPLLSPSPLTTQSQKPVGNNGVPEGRSKAIGYQSGKEIKDALGKLNGIAKKGAKVNISATGVATRDTGNNNGNNKDNAGATASVGADGTNQDVDGNKLWEVISTVYSTGVFIPQLSYKYKYIDLPAYEDPKDAPVDLGLDDDGDPYSKYKPQNIIFGIFDSMGVPLNPEKLLQSLGLKNDGTPEKENTTYKAASWILESPKWRFPSGVYTWPSFGTPIYRWKKGGNENNTRDSKTKPVSGEGEESWSHKTYKKGDKNILNGQDALEGDLYIVGFDAVEVTEYKNFMGDLTRFRMNQADGLTQVEKNESTSTILSKLDVPSHLENVFLYGQSKTSVYKPVNGNSAFPEPMKVSLKPYQIFDEAAANDEKLKAYAISQGKQPGYIWIEPESDYEVKIIRVDPTTKIEYEEAKSEPEIKSDIKSFIKNKTIFKISDNSLFDIEIQKNSETPIVINDAPYYTLDNWNYYKANLTDPNEEPSIQNNNVYKVKINSKLPSVHYSTISSEIYSISTGKYGEVVKTGSEFTYREFSFDGSQTSDSWTSNGLAVTATTGATTTTSGTASGTASTTFNAYDYVLSNLGTFNIDTLFKTYLANNEALYTYTYTNSSSGATSTIGIKLKVLFENRRTFSIPSNPIVLLSDNSRVIVTNGKIERWIYLDKSYNTDNLPAFNTERTISITQNGVPSTTEPTDTYGNVGGDLPVVVTNVSIPKFRINITSGDFPYGKVIDPGKVTNDFLKKPELFSLGKYGSGDASNPQEIDIIKRYMLTDLDTESYYIIEGVLTDKNTQSGNNTPGGSANQNPPASGSGGGYYRLPHAIGAIKVFVSILVDIFSKLIPAIKKLLELFKNPASFVVEIIKEKMGEGFTIFSKESFGTFEAAGKIAKSKGGPGPITGGGGVPPVTGDTTSSAKDAAGSANMKASELSSQLKDIFKNSPLHNHVFVDTKGRFKFLLDGVAMLPLEILGKKIPFGIEMNFAGIAESKPPIKLIFSADLPNSKAKNMQQFLKGSLKEYKGPGSDGISPLSVSDLKDVSKPLDLDKSYPGDGKLNPNDESPYEIIDIRYSTGSFINGVNYNYIYIDLETENLLKSVDDIIASNPDLMTSLDAQVALEKLNNAIKNDPTNEALKSKKKDLKKKLAAMNDSSQPLLKMLLGLVTLPIKIIAGIIEWLMDFFKSLTNPMTLPAKMAEFLSFSWIMKFFTPKGILELAGIKFNPDKITEWLSKATIPNPKPPTDIPDTPSIPNGKDLPTDQEYKDAVPKGKFSIPDDFDLANLDEFLSMPFMPKLPTYTARQFREMPDRPFKLFWPFICMIEKIINGIIDFIWSTLGIEAIIPPPHIKLCSKSKDPGQMDADELNKLLNGDTPKGDSKFEVNRETGELVPILPDLLNSSGPAEDGFIYDVTLDDGTLVKDLNYEQLQKFISDNQDIGYNYKF